MKTQKLSTTYGKKGKGQIEYVKFQSEKVESHSV